MNDLQADLVDAVTVAGHASIRPAGDTLPSDVESDEAWVLQSFQRGEPPFFIEHIRRGVVEAARNPCAALCFSGTLSRPGAVWSEAESYRRLAESKHWWMTESFVSGQKDPALWRRIASGFSRRCVEDRAARDSFENVLYALCRFFLLTGAFPRHLTVISFSFKAERFDFHRAALRWPASRWTFLGVNQPFDLATAERNEKGTLDDFRLFPYGAGGRLAQKRAERTLDPVGFKADTDAYAKATGLESFFAFIGDERNQGKEYPSRMPWEE
jgi:hypothetical protein